MLGLAAGTAVRLTAQPVATFDVLRHDFGSLLWKVGGRTTFKVTNTGDENLTIQDVHPDCGCTVAAWTREPLRPGATGEIYVEYDAGLLGRFRKLLAVKTNASDQPVWLTVSGDVVMEKKEYSGDYPYRIGDIHLSSDNIEFDDVNRGDMPVKVLRVFNNSKKSYLKAADQESLVLIDELGSGTDPAEGAALAASILMKLHSRQIRTLATTHYAQIKALALTTEGIQNACCEFDVETLSPTYRLMIGAVGASNAFAISKRLGLEDDLIENAKEFLQKDQSQRI